MRQPKVCVLRTDGTNCDQEMAYAFNLAGGQPQLVHINELHAREVKLDDFAMLAIPGGFSYGDDVASGKVLANELVTSFNDQLTRFSEKRRPIIGVCNGFQVLVRTGLLPGRVLGTMQATLAHNTSGHFECRWIKNIVQSTPCVFLQSLPIGTEVPLPIAHGEGRFWAPSQTLDWVEQQQQVVLRYSEDGAATQHYPANPNGSMHAIAGVCDETGTILGLMPHPERFVLKTQFVNWRREDVEPLGLRMFADGVAHARRM